MKKFSSLILSSVFLLVFSSSVFAEQCAALFPDGASNAGSSNGRITINWTARITNSPDNILDTRRLIDNSGGTSCDTQSCGSSNSVAPDENFNSFPNVSNDIRLGYQQSATVSPGSYDDLELNTEAILTMEPGTYTFRDDVTLGYRSQIIVSEPGTVLIFVRDQVDINTEVLVNQSGENRNVLIYARDSVQIGTRAEIKALIYSRNDINLNHQTVVTGAISARDRIELTSEAVINYDSSMVESGDFEPFCSSSAPTEPPALVAEWRFDESSWSGSAGEVQDSSGNNYHGDVVNSSGLPTTENVTPVSSGSPGTCRYGEFNGRFDGYVEIADSGIDSPFDLLSFSVSVWVNPNTWPGSDLATIVSKDENFEFHLNSSGQIYWWWGGGNRSLQSSVTVPTGQWSHIAITYEEGEQHIYLNGVSVANRATSDGITLNNDSVFIGTDWNFHSRRFDGLIDEVRIYDGPLSEAEVRTVMNETHDCAGGATLAYFDIDVGSAASVCAPQEITITARDTDDNIFESYIGTIDLSTSSNNGDWSYTGTPTDANGILSTGAGDSGQASYAFEASGVDEGQISLNFENTHAETITISVADTAEGVNSQSDTLSFSENAFVVEQNDPLGEDLIAGRPHQFTVSLVGRDTSDPDYPNSDCGVLDDYNASAVKAWINRSADDPSGASPSLYNENQSDSITLQNSEGAAETLSLNFNSGVASVSLATTDVGEYRLAFLDDGQSYAQSDIRGESNLFTARPFGFLVSIPGNPEASSASGPIFLAAGQSFSVDVQAKAWHANDDLDDDGIPDFYQGVAGNWADNANFSGADILSFGQEGSSESLVLSATQIAPTLGAAASLGGTTTIATFNSGAGTSSDLYIDDVGIYEIQAVLSSAYLGASLSASEKVNSASVQLGRFIPAYYSIAGQSLTAACNVSSFSYLSQDFSIDFTAQAFSVRGTVTPSYEGDYAKLATLSADDFGGVDEALPTNLSSRVTMEDYSLNWSAGEALVSNDLAIARASTLDGPYIDFNLGIDFTDSDGVGVRNSDLNLDVDNDSVDDLITLGSTDLYFGRLVLPNAHGPESATLEARLHTEFWSGSAWVQMTSDSCSAIAQTDIRFPEGSIDNPANRSVPLGSGATNASFLDTSSGAINFVGGDAGLSFSAPGAGNTGQFNIDIDLSNYPWLRFDWNQDSLHDDAALPSAEISFGSYRGHDRIIYWHEVFN